MATRRQDGRFQKTNTWRFVALLILPAAGGFAWDWGNMGWRIAAMGAGGFIGYQLANFAEFWSLRTYRCPQCRADLGVSIFEWQPGRDVVLYCAACGIEWDTGVRSRRDPDDEDDTDDSEV